MKSLNLFSFIVALVNLNLANAQSISSVDPDSASPGQYLQLSVSGTDLFFGTGTNTSVWLTNGNEDIGSWITSASPNLVQAQFNISPTANIGMYDVIVGELSSPTAQLSNGFEIVPPPPVPNPPNLISPSNGSLETQNPVGFSWSSINYAVHYQYQIAEDAGFNQIIHSDHTTGNSASFGFANGQYYWRVRARNSLMEYGPWSQPRNFQMDGLVSVTSITPNEGYQGQDLPITVTGLNLQFDQATGPTQFELVQNASSLTFSIDGSNVINGSNVEYTGNGILEIPISIATGLYDLFFTDNTNTVYSLLQSFNILPEAPAPDTPMLIYPINGEVLTSETVSFDWSEELNASEYHLQVSSSAGFGNPVIDLEGINVSEYQTSLVGGVYYWRVKAESPSQNESNWSAVETFSLDSVSYLTSVSPDQGFAGQNNLSLTISGVNLPFSNSTSTEQSLWLQQGNEQIEIDEPYVYHPSFGSGQLTIPVQAPVGYYDLGYETPVYGPYILPNAFYVNDGNEVQGNVFVDYNNNGVFDGVDVPFPYASVIAGSGQLLQLTQTDGSYTGYVSSGTSEVSLEPISGYSYSPSTHQFNFPGSGDVSLNNNFALTVVDSIEDVCVSLVMGQIREGRQAQGTLTISNIGTVSSSGIASVTLPNGMQMVSASAPNFVVNGSNVSWQYDQLMPINHSTIHFSVFLDIGVYQIGDVLNFPCTAGNLNTDATPANNSFVLENQYVNSYDPNIKQVSPATFISEEFITNNEYLHYTVFFQNTGNAPAIDVYILDTISENLELNTLQYLSSSHNCEVIVLDNRVVEFRFDEINLPDSTSAPEASIGYVNFRIKPIDSFTSNMIIKNKVGIYFDFNQPIITNTTENWIPTSITEIEAEGDMTIYPNPASDFIELRTKMPGQIQIFDALGKEVYSSANLNPSFISVKGFSPGIYTVTSTSFGKVHSQRLIVH